jgi:hypothetical protein
MTIAVVVAMLIVDIIQDTLRISTNLFSQNVFTRQYNLTCSLSLICLLRPNTDSNKTNYYQTSRPC